MYPPENPTMSRACARSAIAVVAASTNAAEAAASHRDTSHRENCMVQPRTDRPVPRTNIIEAWRDLSQNYALGVTGRLKSGRVCRPRHRGGAPVAEGIIGSEGSPLSIR